MRRYYISNVVEVETPQGVGYALAVQLTAVGGTAVVIPTGPDGRPTSTWGFAIVDARDHTAIVADARNDPMPDHSLDTLMNAISGARRIQLAQAFARRGVDLQALQAELPADAGYRDLIHHVVRRKLQADFDLDRFDARDLT